ncbi:MULTISPECIES: pyridoxamine 5'-phosphate oxidase family protein [unclassified Methanoregula]|uniref:pyridoxamine 5'-phosphate oxidase family protein n=1 Tax=unclassified Methanoregula TaxID=2649730 RepID=UPI0009D6274D|nr:MULTISPECIES: pyridoxamine 5'-phosphate oxidase family protein [unclassified Methanoregula]OPX65297.1 MAG: Pyridoxamine 5'-phosphate oxidase [Methanoregula sp. PtaB.Bin085]OPY32206.1 MAG: Pyridoxamine 5'-phosphate oxidase [Methanoregula sp. PtaU1.Bin006]
MVNLTNEIRESLAGTRTAFFATSSKNGIPNVVPIGAFKMYDDGTILVSDQFFNKTLANMKENPHAALSWWGDKGGFQIRGTVTLHTDDEVFLQNVAWMKDLRPQLKPKTAVLLKVTDVYTVKPGPDAGKKIL